uniref:Anaphase-promoting complex subunit 4 WD40 domain-containing protein n=1 Tax=Elphidium margaritaceum TaxID=933848 RepID=A0A6T9ZHI2_9EUKA
MDDNNNNGDEDVAGAPTTTGTPSTGTSGNEQPIYTMDNLVTCVHGVQFNHDGQLLLYWSKAKKQAIRLVHVQTGKVYSNWPKDRGLNFVHKATFSPNSGYLAIGNDLGYVKLIRLHFYGAL